MVGRVAEMIKVETCSLHRHQEHSWETHTTHANAYMPTVSGPLERPANKECSTGTWTGVHEDGGSKATTI